MSVLVHDVIKVLYTEQGYLPDYPHHLISDTEMIEAFLKRKDGFEEWTEESDPDIDYISNNFQGYYMNMYVKPLLRNLVDPHLVKIAEELQDEIRQALANLTMEIVSYLDSAIQSIWDGTYDGSTTFLPDWIYSYMLGEVIGPKSEQLDLHDLLVFLDTDNIDDIFDGSSAYECLRTSTLWLKKSVSESSNRLPTCFGEPHVIKSLRLDNII